jgi:apolipoprotein N-acyltransferase
MYYAIISAFLLFLSFPNIDFWILGWVFIVPFLYGLEQKNGFSSFTYGLIFGLHLSVFLLYSIAVLTLPGFIGLVIYLSLFYGIATWLISFINDNTKIPLYFILPVIWVVMEEAMSWGYMAFTLMNVGITQHKILPFIQIASITGVGGVSFFIVFIGSLIYQSLVEKRWGTRLRFIGVSIIIFVIIYISGSITVPEEFSPQEDIGDLTIGVVQTNVAFEVKTDSRFKEIVLDRYIFSSKKILFKDKVDMIIWPETAIPYSLGTTKLGFKKIEEFAKEQDIYLLSGVQRNELSEDEVRSYNSAMLVNPDGEIESVYDKIHLVPFSETIPSIFKTKAFESVFADASDFTPGAEYKIFDIQKAKFGVLICFESIFPHQSRKLVNMGADFLVVMTIDTWFGKTNLPYIHSAVSKFRAVENRIWVVRSANTGVSAFYDPAGREILATDIFTRDTIKGDITIVEGKTFYTRYGYVFSLLFIVFALIMFVLSVYNRIRNNKNNF